LIPRRYRIKVLMPARILSIAAAMTLGVAASLFAQPVGALRMVTQTGFQVVYHAVFSPDGERALTVESDRLHVWDIDTARLVATHETGNTSIDALAFSPDGETLLMSSWGGTTGMQELNARTLERLRSFTQEGNQNPKVIAWSPDGTQVVTGESDGLVRLWDAVAGREVAVSRTRRTGVDGPTGWSAGSPVERRRS
jgi:WD40 repeat protein